MSVAKLYYWGIPGRAEVIKLAFHVGDIKFEEVTLSGGAEWSELKTSLLPTNPQVNLPLLEVDGQYFVESKAILRYAGLMSNLIPSNPLQQLRMDEALNMTEDIFTTFSATFAIKDNEEKIAARKALCEGDGKMVSVMAKLDSYLAQYCGEKSFICGDDLTLADVALFATFGTLVCGVFDGIPADFLASFANINSFRIRVGTHEKVASRYAHLTEGLLFNAFKF